MAQAKDLADCGAWIAEAGPWAAELTSLGVELKLKQERAVGLGGLNFNLDSQLQPFFLRLTPPGARPGG